MHSASIVTSGVHVTADVYLVVLESLLIRREEKYNWIFNIHEYTRINDYQY